MGGAMQRWIWILEWQISNTAQHRNLKNNLNNNPPWGRICRPKASCEVASKRLKHLSGHSLVMLHLER
jgi:hypothetical protein